MTAKTFRQEFDEKAARYAAEDVPKAAALYAKAVSERFAELQAEGFDVSVSIRPGAFGISVKDAYTYAMNGTATIDGIDVTLAFKRDYKDSGRQYSFSANTHGLTYFQEDCSGKGDDAEPVSRKLATALLDMKAKLDLFNAFNVGGEEAKPDIKRKPLYRPPGGGAASL